GTPDSETPDTLAFQTVAPSAMATATTASISQTATHRVVSSGGPEMAAAASALMPISTPPHPGTAVNAPARSIVSRMKRRFSMAWAWIGCGRPDIENFIAQRVLPPQPSNFRLQTSDFRLQASDFKLQTSSFETSSFETSRE